MIEIFSFKILTLRFSITSLVILVTKVFDNPSKALCVINLSTFGMDFSKDIFTLLYDFKIVLCSIWFLKWEVSVPGGHHRLQP